MDWKEERSKRLAEYILFFHLCALTVMAIAIMSTLGVPFRLYIIYRYWSILGIILGTFALSGMLYFAKNSLTVFTSSESPNIISVILSFLLLIFTAVIVFILDLKGSSFKILYFVPVIYAAINHGRKWGIIFSCLCLAPILVIDLLHAFFTEINKTFEADLILSLIMFIAAWLIGGFIDIERETIKKLAELANKDDLTGLWNKRYFYQVLEELFAWAIKENANLSLIFADVDYFKTYNDALGHLQGDEALKKIGEIICRKSPPGAVAVRYGGEEFAIILPGYSSQEALAVAEQIRKEVENYPFFGKEYQPAQKVTLSLGIATYPVHANTPKELISRADDALFRAKLGRKNRTEIYFSVLDELCNSHTSTDEDLLHTLKTLLSVIHAKDRYTRGHSERVTKYAVIVGEYLGLPQEDLQTIKLSAFLHDIGKIEIERELLNKATPLSEEERSIFKQHPIWGAEIVRCVPPLAKCAPIIIAHHENFDGSGYPFRRKGELIPLGARILRVVDSFDAMTTNRPYRRALTINEALEELKRGAGTLYDPDVVAAFLNVSKQIIYLAAV
ncbi:diguanylate cyclase (GGDEF) domain-containing protein/HDIG domain-containing protein [Thermanaeromonas toyohensis ToBE]|uniref:Diguanylate cyclase (GGDEF) domain-containing protein/HDIG domain-containing protein n=1 Tax=Thermanaeromonas toyohensis ToBE TaxID=698762 RepID=A0A1W1VXU6_9FIRM|nr:diguanylate cyclase [Thermanaeromonas toyohensis]SMB98197.1 diguanylate cyclase (GGDEF) domain-containing protein/HDIG domain-containing protein [Thermanaeromonas toyohensis ToBE]